MEVTFWVMLYLPTKFGFATSWNGRENPQVMVHNILQDCTCNTFQPLINFRSDGSGFFALLFALDESVVAFRMLLVYQINIEILYSLKRILN